MSKKKIFITVLLSIFYGLSYAQILDDSTKQIYGLKTTRFILEEDILNNRKTYYNPDSTLDGFHLFDRNLRSGWLYQDLGNIGTAVKPLFYEPREEIGKQLGFSTYEFYAFDARKAKYYNTRSPYTNMYYVQSGGGTMLVNFTHSQNIKPRLNATIDVRRLTSSKQYGAPQTREERLVDSWAFMANSNYESKDGKYIILGTYNHFNHAPIDQGGIKPLDDSTTFVSVGDLGNYKNYLSRLTSASSRDWRNELHIYQQYLLTNGFQVYHILDYQKRRDYYTDYDFGKDTTATKSFYQTPRASLADTMTVALKYHLIENKFGIKGIYRGFAYRLHLRHRLYNLSSNFGDAWKVKLENEFFTGAWANYFFPDSLKRVYAETEFGYGENFTSRIKGEYVSPKINLMFSFLNIPSTILDNQLVSDVYKWNKENSLNNQIITNVGASTTFKKGNFSITPSAHYSLVDKYIYYDTKAQVQQDTSVIHIFRVGLALEFRWKKLLIANQTYFAQNSEKDIIRMPTLATNTRISYEFVYAKRLHINTGIELYYRSAYLADNYMPLTRQFYLQDKTQNNQSAWGYPVVDVFADLKISKVRVFVKFAHVNQGFPTNGYYVSPTYPGLRRTFFIGANWPLFD